MLSGGAILKATQRLQGRLLPKSGVQSRTLSNIVGAQVFLKFENLQFTASFKECDARPRAGTGRARGPELCPPVR